MQTLRNFISTLAALVALPSLLAAQPQEKLWQKLATFPTRVLTVHFLDLTGPPRIGFVGCDNAVYRTTDGGETWREATYLKSIPNDPIIACDFTFKDSLTGWFANWDSNAVSPYYLTTDGGHSWTAQHAPTVSCSAVYYNAANGVLLLSGWPTTQHGLYSCISTDEGKTWQVNEQATPLNGYAFLDANYGVATNYKSGYYKHTTDGGLTWSDVRGGVNETWQPAVDTATHILYAPSEANGTLDISIDKGQTFADILTSFHTSGCIRVGSCSVLYTQRTGAATFADSVQGIVQSTDNGKSWQPVIDKLGDLGPHSQADTRFFIKGSYIFASSLENEIWRFIGDSTKYDGGSDIKPTAMPRELHILANDCAPVTKTLYIQYLNDCTAAELIKAQIDPADRFQIIGLSLPRPIRGDVPITVEHDPLYHTPDTAKLYLTYHSHGVDSYDTVLLTNVIAGSRYTPRVSMTANATTYPTIKSGDTASIIFTLLDTVAASLGLDSIGISTAFDSTILEAASGPIVDPPFSLLREEHTLGTETIVVRVAPKDITNNTVIATQLFKSFLTTEREAIYTISEIRFNDSVFNGCVATAVVSPPEIPITVLGCGDSTARAFLRGEPLIQILSVGPEIKIAAKTNVDVGLEICNSLGQAVKEWTMILSAGANSIPLNDLQSGFYTCRIVDRSDQATLASLKFVVVH